MPKYTITIADTDLYINTEESPEMVEKLVETVDGRLRGILAMSPRLSKSAAAILCAVDYCAAKIKGESGTKAMEKELKKLTSELEKLKASYAALAAEADEVRRLAAQEVEERKARLREERGDEAPKRADALLIDENINNIEYKMGKCCNPIKGDDIFGFITINAGITIHRNDCPNARRMRERYPYRVMEARWRSDAVGAFRVTVAISAADVPGLATNIMDVASKELKLTVRGINFTPKGDGTATAQLIVEVPGSAVVDMLLHSLRRIRGVRNVHRVN
jgi:GTP pyrophosphokinase